MSEVHMFSKISEEPQNSRVPEGIMKQVQY